VPVFFFENYGCNIFASRLLLLVVLLVVALPPRPTMPLLPRKKMVFFDMVVAVLVVPFAVARTETANGGRYFFCCLL